MIKRRFDNNNRGPPEGPWETYANRIKIQLKSVSLHVDKNDKNMQLEIQKTIAITKVIEFNCNYKSVFDLHD